MQDARLCLVQSLASCVFLPAMILTRNSIFDLTNLPDENLITEVMYSHKKLQCQQISFVFCFFFTKNRFIYTHTKLAAIDSILEHYPGKVSSGLFNKNCYNLQLVSIRHTSHKELISTLRSSHAGYSLSASHQIMTHTMPVIYKKLLAVEKWDEWDVGVLTQRTRFSFLLCNRSPAFCTSKGASVFLQPM